MYSRILVAAVAVTSLTALAACATHDAGAPRISDQEMQVLVSDYYWQRDLPVPRYTSEQLDELLRASADPTLDGERAESQASRVAVALVSVGDERFSQALSDQPASVKRAVAREIHYMWTRHHLHYPKTKRVLQPYI
jgi:heme/copper-type cytochrome/quinol oxidase subunit 2